MGVWKDLAQAPGTGGWKEIYRVSGTGGWKALQIEGSVDVGGPANNFSHPCGATYTYIVTENPANISGMITELDVFTEALGNNVYFGIFYVVSGNTLKCRSAVNVGSLSAGLNSGIAVALAVEPGDYIGCYCSGQHCVSRNYNAGGGDYNQWYKLVNGCIVDSEITYLYMAGKSRLAIYGTG